MPPLAVWLFIEADGPTGTNVWASEKVIDLVNGEGEVTDEARLGLFARKLQGFCDANFRQYMPDIVKREFGKIYCVHLDQFRIIGFFDQSYRDFIALDYFAKKTQKNDQRMNAAYKRVDRIREGRTWTRAK